MLLLDEIGTITFNNVKSSRGELTIVIVLDTRISLSGTPTETSYTAEDLHLRLVGLPNKKTDWNDREFWFGIGNCELKIHDPLEYLELAIRHSNFHYELSTITVTEIVSGEVWYKGYFDSAAYTKSSDNIVSMSFNPLTEQLALTDVKNGSGTLGWNDIYNGKYTFDYDEYYDVYEFLLDTLKLVDPNIEVTIINDWDYESIPSGGETGVCKLLFQGTDPGLRVCPKRLFGHEGTSGWEWLTSNYKDVINLLCRSLGLMITFISFDKVILTTYLENSGGSTYEPDLVHDVKEYSRSKQETALKYLRIKNRYGTELGGYGTKQITSDGEMDIVTLDSSAFSVPHPSSATPTHLEHIALPGGSFTDYAEFLATYYGKYFTSPFSQLKDTAEILGTEFRIRDKLKLKGYLYFALLVDIDLEEGTTKIEGRPFASILSNNTIEYPAIDDTLYVPA